jgi:hypothetical protein
VHTRTDAKWIGILCLFALRTSRTNIVEYFHRAAAYHRVACLHYTKQCCNCTSVYEIELRVGDVLVHFCKNEKRKIRKMNKIARICKRVTNHDSGNSCEPCELQ